MSDQPIESRADTARWRRVPRSKRRRLTRLRSALADLNAGMDALFGLHPSRPSLVEELLRKRPAEAEAPRRTLRAPHPAARPVRKKAAHHLALVR